MNASHLKKYQTAKRLIAKHGRTIELLGMIPGTAPDPTKPWEGGGSTEGVLATLKACFVPFQGSGFGESVETGNMFSADVQVCMCAPEQDLDVEKITKIRDGGVVKAIEWKEVLKPSDVRVLIGMGIKH